jgi:hypothetical protein
MVGEVRRYYGSVTIGASGTGGTTIRAASGERVKITAVSVKMDAVASGSSARIKVEGSDSRAALAEVTDGSPRAVFQGELFIDDSNGITVEGENKNTSSPRPLLFAAIGVKIN